MDDPTATPYSMSSLCPRSLSEDFRFSGACVHDRHGAVIYVKMTSESKKEAFRKYLESSGVLDSLTKVLVALYEENDKPPLAVDFIQHNLGGFTNEEYNKLKAEKDELQTKYDELVKTHEELSKKFEELQLQLPPDDQSPAGAPPPA